LYLENFLKVRTLDEGLGVLVFGIKGKVTPKQAYVALRGPGV
jgi:hypothetical protein